VNCNHLAVPQVLETFLQVQEVNSDSEQRICVNILILKPFLFSYFSVAVCPSGTSVGCSVCGVGCVVCGVGCVVYTDCIFLVITLAAQAIAYAGKGHVSVRPVVLCVV
jgi:hypothetical protein